MKKLLLIACLGAMTVLAQGTDPGPGMIQPYPLFSLELQKYLELSNTQMDTIRRANTELLVFSARKQIRIAQVQREIQEWTGKDPIDAMQLGVRYAELEVIRREMRDEEKSTTAKVRAVLNPAQQAKIRMLEDAVKLQPLINEAACVNLIDAALNQSSGSFSLAGTTIGQIVGTPFAGCIRAVARISPVPLQP